MAFTDDQLRITKRRAYHRPLSATVMDFQNEDMLDLIKRLECAEKVCSMFYPKERTHEEWVKESLDAHEAWRKSCGK